MPQPTMRRAHLKPWTASRVRSAQNQLRPGFMISPGICAHHLTLKEIGMLESDLDKAADIAAANPYSNPTPIERGAIRQLLENAFHGRRPEH